MTNYPLIKFVILFICGIILQSIFSFQLTPIIIIFFSLLLLSVILLSVKQQKFYSSGIILVTISILFYGMIHFSTYRNEKVQYPFNLPINKNAMVYCKITDISLSKKDRIVLTIETDSVRMNDQSIRANVRLLCTVKDSKGKLDKFYSSIEIGNYLSILGSITRARDKRNPGEFDYESTIAEKGIHGLMTVYKISDVEFLTKDVSMLKQFSFRIRKNIDEVIKKFHNGSTSALLKGLILADRGMIDYEVKTEFINAGVIHVLAVSGLHVGFIVLIFIFLFKRFNPYMRYGFTILGLLLFLVITNYPTSVVRATIMAIVMIASPLTGRNYNSINSLALAAFIILLINPSDLFSPGFQLSFSAVLAIVTLYPPLGRMINGWRINSKLIKSILLFFAVSFAAQIGTLPFTLVYFHKVSVVALIANIVVIPLIGFIVGLGIFTILIGPVVLWLGQIYASANELLSFFLFSFVRFLGKFEYAFISIRQFSLWDSVLFYTVIFFLFQFWKKLTAWKSKLIVSILVLAILIVGFSIDNRELLPENKLSVLTIDIGQGDAILIKFPNGETALIDGGNATEYFDNGARIILPMMDYMGIDKIDYGFITHADADHYRGYLALIRAGRVAQIYKSVPDTSEARDVELEKEIRMSGIPLHYFGKSILTAGNVRLYIMNDTLKNDYKKMNMNDKSGVMKLVYGTTSFLFTGDAGLKAENYYLHSYPEFLKSNVLKAGHHGSKTSTGERFLKAVNPDYALISAGIMNNFKHPSPEIIDRFIKNDVQILRTDQLGGILLQSDGYTIKNINWKKEESGFIF
ncbi:MAG: DNA internalization-related competence protein ComEC/Rec2 [Melioribacteraceae bacterium]|nr:DNA internalization-related competence protein ComEC/Rec2 [Melioribacteraceae bacterium]